MSIEYLPANNKITVTGYSALTPCNFTGLWTEDKAGTLELMPATLPAMNMTLTTQIKPSDEVALKIDFILAGSGAGAGDTIDITGTDKDDNAQTETLTTEADGTFTTTKWFKTITDIDCNGFNLGTLTVRQNQWGVVKKEGSIFTIDAQIYLGDASNDAYFGDINKKVFYTGNTNFIFSHLGKGHIYFGEYDNEAEKTCKNGCYIEIVNGCAQGFIGDSGGHGTPITLQIYDTTIVSRGGFSWLNVKDITGRIWASKLVNLVLRDSATELDMDNIQTGWMSAGTPPSFLFDIGNGNINKLNVFNADYAVCHALMYPFTIKNLYARNIRTALILVFLNPTGNSYCIDWDVDWTNAIGGSLDTAIIYRQYTFNLKVIDKDGNGIGNATVILKDKDGNIADQKGFEATTSDADATRGEITEQTVSYGFYNQANGNTLQSYSPHTLTISKAGYQTHRQVLTLDEKIDWRIKLIHSPYSKILGLE